MPFLPASAESPLEWPAAPVTRRESVTSARLRPSRVLAGIALVVLCAVLFCLAVLYVSAPPSGSDPWSLNTVIRKGLDGSSNRADAFETCRSGNDSFVVFMKPRAGNEFSPRDEAKEGP